MNLESQLINAFSLCVSNNCLGKHSSKALEIVDGTQNSPCKIILCNGEFKVENPNRKLLYFLKIDNCILFSQHGKKCDFAVFNGSEIIFVELKKIEKGSTNNHDKRRGKRKDAYEQLENTLEIFLKQKQISLNCYQQTQKLFVIASILDENPPITRIRTSTGSQDKILSFEEKYQATLLTGHIYQFS